MSNSNQESNDDGGNGFNLGPDILELEALLRASQTTADAENLDNVDDISGEYSSLNKTIDELNGFLDRWEERHSRLRNEIREVLTEQEQAQQERSDNNQQEGEEQSITNTALTSQQGPSTTEGALSDSSDGKLQMPESDSASVNRRDSDNNVSGSNVADDSSETAS